MVKSRPGGRWRPRGFPGNGRVVDPAWAIRPGPSADQNASISHRQAVPTSPTRPKVASPSRAPLVQGMARGARRTRPAPGGGPPSAASWCLPCPAGVFGRRGEPSEAANPAWLIEAGIRLRCRPDEQGPSRADSAPEDPGRVRRQIRSGASKPNFGLDGRAPDPGRDGAAPATGSPRGSWQSTPHSNSAIGRRGHWLGPIHRTPSSTRRCLGQQLA